ncbi:hypothetical protein SASPL_130733 [Salvia splendens]|uniref:Transposase-associated domain-containing protein n=1 Tax=Salvia splendens TaxID=180675 RepID=A0A8X8X691_SALSN|nr:hypothetical protein SASPL_130733 [Salvia splendens]
MNDKILCPCKRCGIGISVSRDEAFEHLTVDGFIPGYTQWIAHGELPSSRSSRFDNQHNTLGDDDMQGLVHDAFGVPNEDGYTEEHTRSQIDAEIANGQAREFYKLIDGLQKLLMDKQENFITFPDAMVDLPKSYYEAEKLMKELGLGYEKIDVCQNDYTLYWGANERRTSCDTCHQLRWRTSDADPTSEKRKIAQKVLWYFPVKPRLQRLFMSTKTASHMRWHAENRTNDGYMRHPADSPAWNTFDTLHPSFAQESHNVRL